MQVKGDFAVGRSFDKDYLANFTNNKQTYVDNVLWHHKSLFVQIKDTRNDFPLSGVIGVQHWAQWGGTSTNPKIGKQPQSIKGPYPGYLRQRRWWRRNSLRSDQCIG